MGNLTRDPELKNIGSTNVCNFGIAINRRTKDGEDTTFIEVSSFGKTADNIGKYFQKGKPILIEGRLQLDQWNDNGQQRSKLKVVAERFNFCGSNQSGGQSQGQNQGQSQQTPQNTYAQPQNNYDNSNQRPQTQPQNRGYVEPGANTANQAPQTPFV